jgi:hypothetical protein
MMTNRKTYLLAWAATGLLLFTGCIKDISRVNPEPEPIVVLPESNPLGDGFTAPAGFDWATLRSQSFNFSVLDDFNGQYSYLVELFSSNPLAASHPASPLMVGVCKGSQSFTGNITLPKVATLLYARVTDPKRRAVVYQLAVPASGGTLTARLGQQTASTRTVARTSAYQAAIEAGVQLPRQVEYSAETLFSGVPAVSAEPTNPYWPVYADGDKILIGTEYTDSNPFTAAINLEGSGRVSVYVKGVWKISSDFWTAMDIYVLSGGKVVLDGGWNIANNANLYIQEGGLVDVSKGKLNMAGEELKNFGTINCLEFLMDQHEQEFYNAGEVSATQQLTLNGVEGCNYGTLTAGSVNSVDTHLFNDGTIAANTRIIINEGVWLNSMSVSYGTETEGSITMNNGRQTAFVNTDGATLTGYEWMGGGSLYNDGSVTLTVADMDYVYNACTLKAHTSLAFIEMVIDDGNVETALVNTPPSDITLTFTNGSMLTADEWTLLSSPNKLTGTGSDMSLLRVGKLSVEQYTKLSGKLVLETNEVVENGKDVFILDEGAGMTGIGESEHSVNTCGGTVNEGNEGASPSEPSFPINIGDSNVYTFLFEDMWPQYGDFDMNDAVLSVNQIDMTVRADGSVATYKLQGKVRAVGASKKLGLAVRFPATKASDGGEKIITTDLHLFMGRPAGERQFINTQHTGSYVLTPRPFEVTMEFAAGEAKPEALHIRNVDLFLISQEAAGKAKRQEIHLAGYAPTEKADTDLFGKGNDNSSLTAGRFYLSNENLAWGIVVPVDFAWALEHRNIRSVYPDFATWVSSGGATAKEWYLNYKEGEVF